MIFIALIFMITKRQDIFFYTVIVLMSVAIGWVSFVAPESPQFLLSKRRFDKLEQTFKIIARVNKCSKDVNIKNLVNQLKESN